MIFDDGGGLMWCLVSVATACLLFDMLFASWCWLLHILWLSLRLVVWVLCDGRFGLVWFEYDWFGLGDGCWVCLILIGGWGVCYLVGDCVSLVGCGLV